MPGALQVRQQFFLEVETTVISANRGPVLRTAADPETRRAFMTLYANRAAEENLPILDELVAKRHELAVLMGHASYADYALELNMARTPDNVWNFLNDLTARTEAKAVADVERLREFRAEAEGINTDVPLQPWDTGYYGDLLKRVEYGVDSEKVREYLPMADALEGMMALYQELFDLEIRKVDLPWVWHESVEMYDVVADGRVTGRFYLDLYPREGKESHMYGVPLTPGRLAPEGREIPTAMLLGNFTPPTDDLPSLITHAELRTLFHEFGHGLHHMLTRVHYSAVSGINGVAWDAVELPSQFMENWCWEREALDLIAGHYRSGEKIPAELYARMMQAKNFQSAMQMVRQLEFALFDFRLHHEFDPATGARVHDVLEEVRRQVSVVQPPAFNRFENGFTHIFSGGYAAGYYSYKWAEVLSADAFSAFEESGIFDRETGNRFLSSILEQGGSREPMELFVEFRGREPSIDALLRHSGLAA